MFLFYFLPHSFIFFCIINNAYMACHLVIPWHQIYSCKSVHFHTQLRILENMDVSLWLRNMAILTVYSQNTVCTAGCLVHTCQGTRLSASILHTLPTYWTSIKHHPHPGIGSPGTVWFTQLQFSCLPICHPLRDRPTVVGMSLMRTEMHFHPNIVFKYINTTTMMV